MPTRLRRSRSRLLPGNDDGLSVAEMVVAIWVTVIVLISAGAAFVKMAEAQRSAEAADRGTQLVQDKLETIHKRPYAQVGCYTDDPMVAGVSVCPAGNAPATSPVNSSNGERIVNFGPTRDVAKLGPAPAAVEENFIGDAANGNKYTVTTVVTWADLRDPNRTGALLLVPESGDYMSKRVTVTASWTLGGKTRKVTRQWLRSPTWEEQRPPNAGAALFAPSCVYRSPVCSINITEGQVLSASAGYPASREIEFKVKMSVDTTTAKIMYAATTKNLTKNVGGGISDDGLTLTYVIAAGQLSGVVKPGANTVTISVGTIYGAATTTKDVNWRFPVATASPYQLANLRGVFDNSRDTFNTAPPAGGEPAKNWFCVKDTAPHTLWRYTAVIVDETNVDELDDYSAPKLYATGMNPADLSQTPAILDQHPSATVAGYNPVGGYVLPKYTASGSLNTIRWSYGFQPGTEFPGTSSNIIISGERPGDGAAANASLTMPVYRVQYPSHCPKADEVPVAPGPSVLNGAVVGQSNNLSWTEADDADYYKLYRGGNEIYSGPNRTFTDTPRPGGATSSYHVIAFNSGFVGPDSNPVTLTTLPSAPTSAPTWSVTTGGYFEVTCPTPSAGVDWFNIYRRDNLNPGAGSPLVAWHVGTSDTWTDPTDITRLTSTVYYCSNGNEAGETAWSPGVTALGTWVIPAAPNAPTVTSMWGRTVTFSWPPVAGAVTYTLNGGDATSIVAGTTGTLWLPTDSTPTVTVTATSVYGQDSAPSAGTSVLMPSSSMAIGSVLSEDLGGGTRRNSSLVSPGGDYMALLQNDGNFVIYAKAGGYTYQTGTSLVAEQNMTLQLNSDGNLVLYRNTPTAGQWQRQSQTTTWEVYQVILQDDGNLVAYTYWWEPKWAASYKLAGGTYAQTFFR